MDTKTHLLLKQFLKEYEFTDTTTLHDMYDDFKRRDLFPSFKHFVRSIKAMGVKSKSIRRGAAVLRTYYYDSLADTYLETLHKLVKCPTCGGVGVIKQT